MAIVFFVEKKTLKEVHAMTEGAAFNQSEPINVHEIKAVYGNVWRRAQNAIGNILKRLNAHNPKSGYTVGVELEMVNEMNELTRTLAGLNEILGDNGR